MRPSELLGSLEQGYFSFEKKKNEMEESCVYVCQVALIVSNSLRPQAPLSMGSPGKNIGVGCHFLLRASSQRRDQTHVS